MISLCGALCLCLSGGFVAPAAQELPAPGVRIPLSGGHLFLPAGVSAKSGRMDLTVHLHGSSAVVERNRVQSGGQGALITVALRGLSGVYTERFRDPGVFARLLREAAEAVERRGLAENVRWGRITVSSFSAGFGGVRELLKSPDLFRRIDALVMADSLYSGFTGDPAERRIAPSLMRDFLAFAREAARGKKRFILSYSQLHTPEYASTGEVARYLVAQLGGQLEPVQELWPGGMLLIARYRSGGLEIYGFAGDDGAAHLQHLRHLASFLARATFGTGDMLP